MIEATKPAVNPAMTMATRQVAAPDRSGTVDVLPDGMADPVHDAQRTFRALLDALARPGKRIEVASIDVSNNRATSNVPTAAAALDLPPATVAVVLALTDADTPVWWQRPTPLRSRWLRFHTGADSATAIDVARFVVIDDAQAMPSLDLFAAGTDEAPDQSATLIVAVPAFDGGATTRWSGPGIAVPIDVAIRGLASTFWSQWVAQHAAFPRGVDVVFVAGSWIIGLPRTVVVQI